MSTQNIAISKIQESPTNPRKTFRALDELAASIKVHGVLQPIVARPLGTNGHTTYEIVFGARRFRATKLAGLEEMPVDVREYSDETVSELQLVENVQREDVDPIEEAEGYERLMKEHGYTVDDIAAKIGKSKGSVYARLKLCALVPEGRKWFSEGRLTESTALYVARVPAALQVEALKLLEDEAEFEVGDKDAPLPARMVADVLQRKFMLRLADAPFNRHDATLVPAAGACTNCPKRTGAQPELFADVKVKDTCTDPPCFNLKRDAAWEREKARAIDIGTPVIEGKDAKKLFRHGSLVHGTGKVDLEERADRFDPKSKTLEERIGKKLPEGAITLVRDDAGKVHKVVDQELVAKLDPKRTEGGAKPASKMAGELSGVDQLKTKAERAAAVIALGQVVAKVEKRELDAKMWRVIVLDLIDVIGNVEDHLLIRRGLMKDDDEPTFGAAEDALKTAIGTMSAGELRGLFVEISVGTGAYLRDASPLVKLCDLLKIDRKQLVAKELARLKTEAKKPPPPKEPKPESAPKKSAKKKAAKK